MPHAIGWFQIPANDLQRAKRFYEAILQITMMEVPEPMPMKMAFFPADGLQGEIGGAIVEGEGCVPTGDGSWVFLNAGSDLAPVLDRVVAQGGEVLMPKTAIPMGGGGSFAMFRDCEGNTVGLVSMG